MSKDPLTRESKASRILDRRLQTRYLRRDNYCLGVKKDSANTSYFGRDQTKKMFEFLIDKYENQAGNMAREPKMEIALCINSKDIEMNEFVQQITCNLVPAILKSLHLDEEPKTATLNPRITENSLLIFYLGRFMAFENSQMT